MLTIRPDQAEAFRQYHLQKFEDEMVEHLENFAPRHWKVIGEPTGREVIRLGVKQAEKYGFTNRGPVRFYIEMMFFFGSFFDTDPQYPWITEVLNDPESMDQMVRADRLYDKLTTYWDVVAGPNNEYELNALRRLSQARAEDYVTAGASLENCFLAGLNTIYPQKCAYIGEPSLRKLLNKSFLLADKHGFTSDQDIALMAAFAFFLGHECTRDPLHGWIARRLANPRFSDATQRASELRTKAMLYLEYVLEVGYELA